MQIKVMQCLDIMCSFFVSVTKSTEPNFSSYLKIQFSVSLYSWISWLQMLQRRREIWSKSTPLFNKRYLRECKRQTAHTFLSLASLPSSAALHQYSERCYLQCRERDLCIIKFRVGLQILILYYRTEDCLVMKHIQNSGIYLNAWDSNISIELSIQSKL